MKTSPTQERSDILKEHLSILAKTVTRSEFTNAMADLIKFVTNIRNSNAQEFSLIKSSISMLAEELKKDTAEDLAETKDDALAKINKALKEQDTGMKFIYDKVAKLEDGEDARIFVGVPPEYPQKGDIWIQD